MAGINAQVSLKGSFEPMIKGFSDKSQRGIIRGALRRTAQQTVLKAAKKNLISVGGGKYKKGLTVKTSVTNTKAEARIGGKRGTEIGRLGHLIERETDPHVIRVRRKGVMVGRKDGIFYGAVAQHPGTRARPWLNPAMDDNRGKVMDKFGDLVREEIAKAVAKGKR